MTSPFIYTLDIVSSHVFRPYLDAWTLLYDSFSMNNSRGGLLLMNGETKNFVYLCQLNIFNGWFSNKEYR